MTGTTWRDQVAGERLNVDREFAERVRESGLTNHEWDLVMSAVEFDIEDPDDEERARIVADTSKVESVLDALSESDAGRDAAGVGAGADADDGASGVIDSIRGAFGFGGGGTKAGKQETAERLAEEYAEEFQAHLERRGRWEQARATASTARDGDEAGGGDESEA